MRRPSTSKSAASHFQAGITQEGRHTAVAQSFGRVPDDLIARKLALLSLQLFRADLDLL
jgi:hypothetical protein